MTDNTPENEVREAADDILAVPSLVLDSSVPRQVTVHWGPNPANEDENARPDGTVACEIQFAHGGIPVDVNIWRSLDTATESPVVHSITDTSPSTYVYRARYIDKDQKADPYSAPAKCTVRS